jgi:threonine synthase
MIKYYDTRSLLSEPLSFREVVLEGIARGGGLFVPERVPAVSHADILALAELPYRERAAFIFERFELGVPGERIRDICREAYGANFSDEEVAPVREIGGPAGPRGAAPGAPSAGAPASIMSDASAGATSGASSGRRFVLELWHGPTLAFKDMALQCMPLFFSEALDHAQELGQRTPQKLILVATSGDTGVAALNGFADRAHVKIIVCYPRGGVSPVQEQQMTTQPGGNLTVFAVDGDFDCCQRLVKTVFADQVFCEELAAGFSTSLSSANSINWGRLLPQIVYYFSAYADLVKRGVCGIGDPLDVCVPSGNFGNILGCFYAKLMGLPVGRLLCASNTNRILTDFLHTGAYDLSDRSLVKTASPSMDILISSNLERLLFELSRDGERVRAWMHELAEKRVFRVDAATRALLARDLVGDWVDTDTCLRTLGDVFREHGYLLDPHSAVAWEVARRHGGGAPMLIVSTAHWSKFPADVMRGLRGLPPEAPLAEDEFELVAAIDRMAPGSVGAKMVRSIQERPVRFRNEVEPEPAALEAAIRAWLAGEG